MVTEPSGNVVTFAGPEMFAVAAVFPVLRFVADTVKRARGEKDHGSVCGLENLAVFPIDRETQPDLEAAVVRRQGEGVRWLKLPPGPRASAGPAVTTPPNMPNSAPSATITPSRLIATTAQLDGRPGMGTSVDSAS
jgi:hypothetical protein